MVASVNCVRAMWPKNELVHGNNSFSLYCTFLFDSIQISRGLWVSHIIGITSRLLIRTCAKLTCLERN